MGEDEIQGVAKASEFLVVHLELLGHEVRFGARCAFFWGGANASSSFSSSSSHPGLPPLFVLSFQTSAALGETLDVLARSAPAVRFARVVAPSAFSMQLLGVQILPAVVILREGSAVARVEGTDAFGGADGDEGRLRRWLAKAGLPVAVAEAAVGSDDEPDEEAADGPEPCVQCGRRYAHQHLQPPALQPLKQTH